MFESVLNGLFRVEKGHSTRNQSLISPSLIQSAALILQTHNLRGVFTPRLTLINNQVTLNPVANPAN
jgi:hypothetical protein